MSDPKRPRRGTAAEPEGPRLAGKVAVVTGATGGIGGATALAWARAGADLVISGRSVSKLANLRAQIEGLGRRCLSVECDVTNEDDVHRLAQRALAEFQRVAVLLNSAGSAFNASVMDTSAEDLDRIFAVNLRGTFLCCKAFLPSMISRGTGVIINIGTAAEPAAGKFAYRSSKLAVLGLTQTLAEEVRDQNISVNVVRFGTTVDTQLARDVNPGSDPSEWARPEDVTDMLTLLAAQDGNFVSGAFINLSQWRGQWRPVMATPPPAAV